MTKKLKNYHNNLRNIIPTSNEIKNIIIQEKYKNLEEEANCIDLADEINELIQMRLKLIEVGL